MMRITRRSLLIATAIVCAGLVPARGDIVVYATESKSGASSSIFGTLDLTTGHFNEIASTNELFQSLTVGPGGGLYGFDQRSGHLYSISASGTTTQYGSVSTSTLWGLAYSSGNGFYGVTNYNYLNSTPPTFENISSNGSTVSSSTPLSPNFSFSSGSLSYGPDGNLYANALDTSPTNNSAFLYKVDAASGTLTQIGTGLGTPNKDALTLVNAGGQLYGIDTTVSNSIGIYTVNTSTGTASFTNVDVTGLQSGYTLDTAGGAVPEPGSLTLALISTLAGLAYARYRRRHQ